MTIRGALTFRDERSLWNGRKFYQLYLGAFPPLELQAPIFELARLNCLVAFSTLFDGRAVAFLEDLRVSACKVASFEDTDRPPLKRPAETGKPVTMPTGAATLADSDDAVPTLRNNGCVDMVALKRTSTFPASPENTNLARSPNLRQMFKCYAGLSEDTMGIGASVVSVAFGDRPSGGGCLPNGGGWWWAPTMRMHFGYCVMWRIWGTRLGGSKPISDV